MGFELNTLLSRRALYKLSYQGNSACRGSNLQHKTIQDKGDLKPLCYESFARGIANHVCHISLIMHEIMRVKCTAKKTKLELLTRSILSCLRAKFDSNCRINPICLAIELPEKVDVISYDVIRSNHQVMAWD